MAIVKQVTLVQVDATNNHNKFYKVELDDAGTLTKSWGRVGAQGSTKVEPNSSEIAFEHAVSAKMKRGYKPVNGDMASQQLQASAHKDILKDQARKNLAKHADPVLHELISRLAEANRHAIQLASGEKITFTSDNVATTALGPVTSQAISQAKDLLQKIYDEANNDTYERAELISDYLTLIPQQVGGRRGWHKHFVTTQKQFDSQSELLNMLEAAINTANANISESEINFRYKISLASDEITAEISKRYEKSKNAHHQDAKHLKVKRVYVLEDGINGEVAIENAKAFKTRNIQKVWHGSPVHNIFNILRIGLANVGTETVKQNAGAMFGPGIYGSVDSTKAVRYSMGLWGQSGRTRGSVFMFAAEFAMGWELRPTVRSDYTKVGKKDPATGKIYRSINVRPNTIPGCFNQESIVRNAYQVRLNYLVELH